MCFLFLVDWDIELIHLSCSQCLIIFLSIYLFIWVHQVLVAACGI